MITVHASTPWTWRRLGMWFLMSGVRTRRVHASYIWTGHYPPISIIINQLVKTYHCFWSQYICLPSSYYSFLFFFSWKSLPRILVTTNSEDKRDQRWHALWVWKIIRIPTLQPTKKSLYPTNKLLTCKSAWVKLGEH